MLRVWVLLLLVANLGVLAWHRGGLAGLTSAHTTAAAAPAAFHPERLTVIVPGAAAAASAAAAATAASSGADAASGVAASAASAAELLASAPALPGAAPASGAAAVIGASSAAASAGAACLEAGPFDEPRWAAAQVALRSLLPAGRWTETRQPVPGRWIVYMGRYGDAAALARKEVELRRIPSIQFETRHRAARLGPRFVAGSV